MSMSGLPDAAIVKVCSSPRLRLEGFPLVGWRMPSASSPNTANIGSPFLVVFSRTRARTVDPGWALTGPAERTAAALRAGAAPVC